MKSAEDIKRYFQKATLSTNPDKHEAIFEKIQNAQALSTTKTPVSHRRNLRRNIMKSPITKIAAAAVIIIAVTLGLFEFIGTGDSSGVVWADVAKKIQSSTGITYRTIQTQTVAGLGKPIEKNEITYYSPKYGMKVENFPGEEKTVTTCLNFTDKTRTILMHNLKKYMRDNLDVVPENQGRVIPEEIVQKFLSGEYKELGRQTIEGVLAEGIEVDKSSGGSDRSVYQLWVSVETGYPVKLDADVTGRNGDVHIDMTMDQFQWDVELDAEVFKVDIPSDYTPMEMPQP